MSEDPRDQVLGLLDSPNLVCESAYRAVHEMLTDAIDSNPDKTVTELADLALSELENLTEWAATIRAQIAPLGTP